MSFHDVDRYRGSCLIVSKPRGRGSSSQSMGGRSRPNQEGAQSKHEASSHFGGSSGRGSAPHHSTGALEGSPFRSGYLMEGGSALAGMPLFSLMPHRRGGKHPPRPHQQHQQHHQAQYRSGGGGGRPGTGRSSSHGPAGSANASASGPDHRELQRSSRERHDSGDSQGGPPVDPNELDEVERIPLARLALHTQGAPLILPNRGKKCPGTPKGGVIHEGGGGERGLRAESKGPRDDTSPLASSDTVSVTSDEGSTGHSENSLPRIIKPRKRRKKDRKPGGGNGGGGAAGGGGGGNVGTGSSSCNSGGQDPEAEDTNGTIVTLKPYMPMCYNYDEDSNSSCSSSSSSSSSSRSSSSNTNLSCSSTNGNIHIPLTSTTVTTTAVGGTASVSTVTLAPFCHHRGDGTTVSTTTTKCAGASGSPYPSYAPPRQCGCLHCIGGVFPTPPPSPASSSTSSTSCSLSGASSSSGSDDEPHPPLLRSLSEPHQAGTGVFSRSLSEPQAVSGTTRLQISSTVSHSFSGHRDIDIKFIKSDGLEGDLGHSPPPPQGRARHYSVPLPPYRERRYSEESSASTASTSSTSREQEFAIYHKYAVSAAPPPQRPWLTVAQPDRNNPCSIYTVMCYNVLCDKYATRQMYGYCPSWALDWEYRKKGIFEEIRQYMADIITLQEIETDQFYNFFLPQLKSEGYNGIFSPKSRAKTMAASERKYVDGCAIFWRTNKFSLLKEHLIEFNQLAMANHEGSEEMLNRVMTKDNIGLAALLETKEAAWEGSEVQPDPSQVNQAILVCTAHIHWDPEYCDVKLIQTMMLMSEVRQIMEASQQTFRPGHKMDVNNIHLLLCGDLNSLPDSGVVEFLTKGSIPMDHPDFKELGYKSCLQKLSTVNKPNSNMYTHNFKIADSYNTAVMPYTNYTYDFKGVIDYIFHNHTTMKVLALLGSIDPDWFRENKVAGCPHPHIPSDHFPLLVQLEMRPLPPANSPANGLLRR